MAEVCVIGAGPAGVGVRVAHGGAWPLRSNAGAGRFPAPPARGIADARRRAAAAKRRACSARCPGRTCAPRRRCASPGKRARAAARTRRRVPGGPSGVSTRRCCRKRALWGVRRAPARRARYHGGVRTGAGAWRSRRKGGARRSAADFLADARGRGGPRAARGAGHRGALRAIGAAVAGASRPASRRLRTAGPGACRCRAASTTRWCSSTRRPRARRRWPSACAAVAAAAAVRRRRRSAARRPRARYRGDALSSAGRRRVATVSGSATARSPSIRSLRAACRRRSKAL